MISLILRLEIVKNIQEKFSTKDSPYFKIGRIFCLINKGEVKIILINFLNYVYFIEGEGIKDTCV